MKKTTKILFLLLLLGLGGCKYNYIVLPAHEKEKQEIKQAYPVPDRWNYVDIKRLERVSDSIANLINRRYEQKTTKQNPALLRARS